MASIREDRPRLVHVASTTGRRSVGLLVLLFLAVLAAITFMSNVSRRPVHHVSAPLAMAAAETPAAEPAAGAVTEPTAAPATGLSAVSAAAPSAAGASAAAATPTEVVEAADAPSQAQIARVVADGRPGLHACYQRALVRDETLMNGNVKVRASVAPSGRVDSVAVNAPPDFRAMSPCLKRAVSHWRFPEASDPYETQFALALHGAE